MNSSGV